MEYQLLTCCCGIFVQLRYTPVATRHSHNLYYVKLKASLLLNFGKLVGTPRTCYSPCLELLTIPS